MMLKVKARNMEIGGRLFVLFVSLESCSLDGLDDLQGNIGRGVRYRIS